jgi:hypothetical protein
MSDTAPDIPENAIAWKNQPTWENTDFVCYVDEGETYVAERQLEHGDYYIAGEATISNFYWNNFAGQDMNIYVLPTGKLNLAGAATSNVHIYVWGQLNVQVEKLISAYGNTDACSIYCKGDLALGDGSHSLDGGTLYVKGSLSGNMNYVQGNAWLIVGCGTEIGSSMNLNVGGSVDFRGNATVNGDIIISSGSGFAVTSGIYLKAKTIELNNDEVVVSGTPQYTFIEADKIVSNTHSFKTKLNGSFAILCPYISAEGEFVYKDGYWDSEGSSYYELEFLSDVLFNEQITEKNLTIPTSCSKDAETNTDTETDPDPDPEPDPEPQPDPKKVLETIAEVEPDHTHNISSTGIDLANGKIYVSWHERGNGYHGCVEVGQVTDDACSLLQFFETPASSGKLTDKSQYGKDFNHIIVDTQAGANRIYVVGNEFDGGLLGYVDLGADGLVAANSGSAAALNYRRLWGADGNSIIRNGDYLQLATTYGYEAYTLPSLDRAVRDTMPGRAKYIVKDDSRILGMHFQTRTYRDTNIQTKLADEDEDDTSDNLQEVDVTIDEFPTTDYLFEQRRELFSTGLTVAPVNGKNVVAVDGTDIYLCRGALGLTRIAASGDTTNFILPYTQGVLPRGYVNGVYVDQNYVYVAYGSAGLYVLNKADLSVVAQHANVGGKSANFVKADDKYIYVAYGRAGWHVYKLVDAK